ncbi:MAG TPA: histidine kinase dimerization/phosphoacceptor domain -containing protein [Allosphingosinicella sp.]|nr:histidine kinase dimerization/phosphoacceptor domain -containing protein [Allosphingosinicella sp.]
MRRIVRLDLPRRLGRHLPRPATEALTGLIVASAFAGLRIALNPVVGEFAPFAFAILAMVLATLVAGWRSGLVAILVGLALDWYFVIEPHGRFALSTGAAVSLGFATVTAALILLALALYQREVRAGEIDRARRINFLSHALREMDHRTRNNFQIVMSLLQLQGNRSGNAEAKAALGEAVERLKAVSSVYESLTLSSQGLGTIRLQDQLQGICDRIREGLLPDGVVLETELEPILVPHETGVCIGIVVNELVTNACKHAFPDRSGRIVVSVRRDGQQALVAVVDDGRGMPGSARARRGLGSRLIEAFVKRLDGRSDLRSSEAGTTHTIMVPLASISG